MIMNIAIIGGRDFDNYELLKQTLLSAPSMVWIYWTHLECDHVNIYHYQTAGL